MSLWGVEDPMIRALNCDLETSRPKVPPDRREDEPPTSSRANSSRSERGREIGISSGLACPGSNDCSYRGGWTSVNSTFKAPDLKWQPAG